MFLQNPARTAASVDPNLSVARASRLQLRLAVATGGPIATSVSIVGTTAYVGAWDGDEYAISITSGRIIWKRFLGTDSDSGCAPSELGVTSSATIVGDTLYVGGGGAYWYALSRTTGRILWKVYTGAVGLAGAHYNWSSPLIYGGYAYIGVASNCDDPLVQGHLMKVAISGPHRGQVVANHNFVPNGEIGGGVWTSPTLDTGTDTIFVSTGTLNDHTQTQSQAIVALNARTLRTRSVWQLPFEAAVADSDWGTTPTLTTDSAGAKLVSVANKNGILYTFRRNDIAKGPIWQRRVAIGGSCPQCGEGTISSGVFANGVLYYAGGFNYNAKTGLGSGGSISALNPGTGKVIWTRQTEQPIMGSPAYVNGMIAEAEGSTFEVLNARNGALLYSAVLPAPVDSAVSVARSQFFLGALNGHMYSFGLGSVPRLAPDRHCPAGFTCQDIRRPRAKGAETTRRGSLTVTAPGAGIHGSSDQFRFISKPVTGNSQSSVEITFQALTAGPVQPQAGLMVRQSAAPGSPFYAVLANPSDGTANRRPDLGIWYRAKSGSRPVEVASLDPSRKPVRIMIQRSGNLFSAGISHDGVHYQLIPGSTVDLDLPATTLQGIAADSGSSTRTAKVTFRSLAVSGRHTVTMTPPAPADPCPSGWTCSDIGNPGPPGDTTSGGAGAFTLDGTGTGIEMSGSDSFHYVYRKVSGNETLSALVSPQNGQPASAQDGIMMRASSSPAAAYYSVLLNPGGSATVQWRTYDGVPSLTNLPLPSVTPPAYVEIVRYDDTALNPAEIFFSALTSADGTNWTPVLGSTVAINMGSSYLAGMAASSGSAGAIAPVSYSAVSLAAASTPPPGLCPADFTCNDVGTDTVPGNQIYLSPQQSDTPAGSWTIDAGGTDIWGNYDDFRFIYQGFPLDPANSTNGDGTISARVVSQADPPGGDFMKTGVMIRSRSGTDPQAPYYAVFETPQHGVAVQWRSSEAAQTSQVLDASAPAAPVWLLASRYTDPATGVVYYSAYTSTDGVTFSIVPGSTVALDLAGPLVAGIASDSFNGSAAAQSVVDDLASLPGSQPPPS